MMKVLPQPCHQVFPHPPTCHALASLLCEVFLLQESHQVFLGLSQSVYPQTCFGTRLVKRTVSIHHKIHRDWQVYYNCLITVQNRALNQKQSSTYCQSCTSLAHPGYCKFKILTTQSNFMDTACINASNR